MPSHRRYRPLTALPLAAVVVLAMCGPAGQAAAAPLGKPDLFTRQGIDQYLLSHGVNPATAIRQAGPLNYVGTACPGKQWHCLAPTHAPVVQVAPPGGVNVYHCSARPGRGGGCFVLQVNAGAPAGGSGRAATSSPAGPPPGTNSYVCLQYADSDTADLDSSGCAMDQTNTTGDNDAAVGQLTVQKSTDTQSASETVGTTGDPLTQTNDSGTNRIIVGQVSLQKNSDTPTAYQTTTVSQSNGTGQNQAIVKQQVQQQVSDGAAVQDQEAQQFLCLTQDSPSGQNQATVGQQMTQQEQDSATDAAQYQNQQYGPETVDCGSGTPLYGNPNMAAQVLQDEQTVAATGANQETIKQGLQEQERSTSAAGTVTQQQGSSSAAVYGVGGGLAAVPDQDSAGLSQATTDENVQQVMQAAGTSAKRRAGIGAAVTPSVTAAQDQYNITRQPPAEGIQGSDPKDTFQLSQDSTQQAAPAATQYYDIDGDCITTGTCDVQQAATSNTGTQTASCMLSTCAEETTNSP